MRGGGGQILLRVHDVPLDVCDVIVATAVAAVAVECRVSFAVPGCLFLAWASAPPITCFTISSACIVPAE